MQIFNFFRSKKNREIFIAGRKAMDQRERGKGMVGKRSPSPDEIQSLPRVGITAGGTLARGSPASRQCWSSHRDENIARDFIIDRRGPCLRNCRVAFLRPFLFCPPRVFSLVCPPRLLLAHTGYFHRSVLIIRSKEPLECWTTEKNSLRGHIPRNSNR